MHRFIKQTRNTLILSGLLVLSAVISHAFAQSVGRTGTAAAPFLRLPVGARFTALAQSNLALPNDPSGLFWNPASTANIEQLTVFVNSAELYLDLKHHYAGVLIPLGGSHMLAFSGTYLNSGDIEITTIAQPLGTGKYYDMQNLALGVTYAQAITDRFSVGATLKYVQENIWNETARTLAVDAGVQLRTGIYGSHFGMSVTNLGGPLRLHGKDLEVDVTSQGDGGRPVATELQTESWPLPVNLNVGFALPLLGYDSVIMPMAHHRAVLTASLNDPVDALIRNSVGIEYDYGGMLFLRGGYHIGYDLATYSLGGGLRREFAGMMLQADYAYADYSALGGVHHVSLVMGFGG